VLISLAFVLADASGGRAELVGLANLVAEQVVPAYIITVAKATRCGTCQSGEPSAMAPMVAPSCYCISFEIV